MGAYIDCGSCGAEMGGYTRKELETQGWTWQEYPDSSNKHLKNHFVLCSDCTHDYEKRREVKKALETAQS
jgi:hypothetical protein